MIRNIKALGLAAMAILAMAAFASSAMAEKPGTFTASSYPVHVFGEDTDDTFTVSGSVLNCTHGTFSGEAKAASTSITITPVYTNCTKNSTEPATVTTNGCAYVFEVGTMSNHAEAHGSVEIECPAGKSIEVHSYANHTTHTSGSSNCTITVGPQTVENVLYTNKEENGIKHIHLESTNGTGIIVSTQIHGSCSFGFTLTPSGDYDAGVTVKGTNGVSIDVGTK